MDFVLKKELETSNLVFISLNQIKKPSEVKKLNNLDRLVIARGLNEESNRAILESKSVDILLSPESISERDFIHFRNSGLNQVLCKLAKKNDIAIGFDFGFLIRSGKKETLLGRMMQNVILCRKYKLKIVLGSFASNSNEIRNKSEIMSFGKVIGMNGKEIKEALNFRKKEEMIKKIK